MSEYKPQCEPVYYIRHSQFCFNLISVVHVLHQLLQALVGLTEEGLHPAGGEGGGEGRKEGGGEEGGRRKGGREVGRGDGGREGGGKGEREEGRERQIKFGNTEKVSNMSYDMEL